MLLRGNSSHSGHKDRYRTRCFAHPWRIQLHCRWSEPLDIQFSNSAQLRTWQVNSFWTAWLMDTMSYMHKVSTWCSLALGTPTPYFNLLETQSHNLIGGLLAILISTDRIFFGRNQPSVQIQVQWNIHWPCCCCKRLIPADENKGGAQSASAVSSRDMSREVYMFVFMCRYIYIYICIYIYKHMFNI